MAINFGSSFNSAAYYQVDTSAGLVLPDADWCVGVWVRFPQGCNTAADFQYLISAGTLGAANSFHAFFGDSSNSGQLVIRMMGAVGTEINTVVATLPNAPDFIDNTDRLLIIQRRGSNFEGYLVAAGAQVTTPDLSIGLDGNTTIDLAGLNLGRRADGATGRYFQNVAGDFFVFYNSLSLAQIEYLANGVRIDSILVPKLYLRFVTASPYEVDLFENYHATAFGVGILSAAHPTKSVVGFKARAASDGSNWDRSVSGGNRAICYRPDSSTPHSTIMALPSYQVLKKIGLSSYIDSAPRSTTINVGVYEFIDSATVDLIWEGELVYSGSSNTSYQFFYLDVDFDASAWSGKRLGVGMAPARDGGPTPIKYHSGLGTSARYDTGIGSAYDLPDPWSGTGTAFAESIWAEFEDAAAAESAFQFDAFQSDAFQIVAVAGDQNFTAPLLVNEQAFFGAVVTPGVVNFSAPLVSNDQTFFAPQVTPGVANFSAPALLNDQTFFGATVTPGSVNFAALLLTNNQAFFGGQVSPGAVNFAAPLLTNSQTFFGGIVSNGATIFSAPLVANEQTFFGATVSPGVANFSAPLFANSQAFFGGQLNPGVANFVAPLLANTQTFLSGAVTPGAVNAVAPLLANTQTFFTASILPGVANFSAPFLINNQTFFGAQITPGAVIVETPLLENIQSFFGGQITGGLQLQWFQNLSLTVYYKPRDRRVKAVAEDRTVRANSLDRTVKFRF